MKVELPERMYRRNARQIMRLRLPPRLAMLLCSALALAALWQLGSFPGSQIRKFDPPVDMPWSGRGLGHIYIDAEGNWVINRTGYADRYKRYAISASGTLTRTREANFIGAESDISGISHGGTPVLSWGAKLKVKASISYREWVTRYRDEHKPDQAKGEPGTDPEKEIGATGRDIAPAAQDVPLRSHLPTYVRLADEAMRSGDSYIPIEVMPERATSESDKRRVDLVLKGHHYFPVFDSWAFIEPDLWLTSDRLRYLHHLRVEPDGKSAKVLVEKSVPLDLGAAIVDRSAVAGVDPVAKQLFIVLASGERFWFDPQSLAMTKTEKLPGVWEFEYAEIGYTGKGYSFYRGSPLTKNAYERIIGGLMVVFLGSLLGLGLAWRSTWRSTAEATTEASASNNSSSST